MKVKVKYAASQPEWTELEVTPAQYAKLFLIGALEDGQLIAFVQSLSDHTVIYDMHRRQWVQTNDLESYMILSTVHSKLESRGTDIEMSVLFKQLMKNARILNKICEQAE